MSLLFFNEINIFLNNYLKLINKLDNKLDMTIFYISLVILILASSSK